MGEKVKKTRRNGSRKKRDTGRFNNNKQKKMRGNSTNRGG
jgi:hypothetical protein